VSRTGHAWARNSTTLHFTGRFLLTDPRGGPIFPASMDTDVQRVRQVLARELETISHYESLAAIPIDEFIDSI